MTSPPSTLRFLAPAVLSAVLASLLAGCTGSEEPVDEPEAATSTSESPSAEPVDTSPPRVGACYRLTLRDAARPTSAAEPVPCTGARTTRTIAVAKLGTGRRTPDVESRQVRDRLTQQCTRTMTTFLGGTTNTQRLSRFQAVWFTPNEEQLAAGADWVRCDVLAFGRGDDLMLLPRLRLEGILNRPTGLEVFGLCGTAAPGASGFERVACRFRHSWVAISTLPIAGGERYPGEQRVRAAGDQTCSDQVNSRSSDLEFDYGWEWPTAEQWRAGQRYGFCWAPASLA